jgi:formylglycine-generating enzyme required for sulfatase activity
LRDVVAAPTASPGGAFTLLCGCGEGEQAREVRELRQGLFTWAFMEELEEAVQAGRELRLDDACESELRERMNSKAVQCGLPGNQRPWIARSGAVPVLLSQRGAMSAPSRAGGPRRGADLAGMARVLCPHCGLRNDPDETFRCRVCGRDYLCRDHFVRAERCCEECADKLIREREELKSKEPAAHPPAPLVTEADRRQTEEAARRRAEAERAEALRLQELEKQRQEAERKRAEAQAQARAEAERRAQAEEARRARWPKPGRAWENSLGLSFVPGPAAELLMCAWPVRVADYEAFVKATQRSWPKPTFKQGPTHAAANVSWEEARAFCLWLTERERAEGWLGPEQLYRLPTDLEWSRAVGLTEERGRTPAERDCGVPDAFPWGTQWPPPKGAGNYAPGLGVDEYEFTSPVGRFAANANGLYDLGGNVWEWCEDEYAPGSGTRVLRGASWLNLALEDLLSSSRSRNAPGARSEAYGFRLALVAATAPPATTSK